MKTDSQLQRDVLDELEWDPAIHCEHIGIIVDQGIVTLTGHVPTYPEKLAAEKAVRRVQGVRGIAEEIEVRFGPGTLTKDADIAQRVLTMLDHDITVPHKGITVQVENGWVKLTGQVDWNYQREAAKRIAGNALGVLGVTNLIEVRTAPAPSDIKDRIVAAFKRSAESEASGIIVTATGNTVHLAGRVQNWHDRSVAEYAAWGAPGVTKVDDQLQVA